MKQIIEISREVLRREGPQDSIGNHIGTLKITMDFSGGGCNEGLFGTLEKTINGANNEGRRKIPNPLPVKSFSEGDIMLGQLYDALEALGIDVKVRM